MEILNIVILTLLIVLALSTKGKFIRMFTFFYIFTNLTIFSYESLINNDKENKEDRIYEIKEKEKIKLEILAIDKETYKKDLIELIPSGLKYKIGDKTKVNKNIVVLNKDLKFLFSHSGHIIKKDEDTIEFKTNNGLIIKSSYFSNKKEIELAKANHNFSKLLRKEFLSMLISSGN